MTEALDRSTLCVSHIPILQSTMVLPHPVVQGSPSARCICMGTLSTMNAVDHTLPRFDWNRVRVKWS